MRVAARGHDAPKFARHNGKRSVMFVRPTFGRALLAARRLAALVGNFDDCDSTAPRAVCKYRLSQPLDMWQSACFGTAMTFAAIGLAILLMSSLPASAEATVLPPDCLTPTQTIAPQTI